MPVFSVAISDEGLCLCIFEMLILVERHSQRSLMMAHPITPATHWCLSCGEGCSSRNTVSKRHHGDLVQCLNVHCDELHDRLEIRLDCHCRWWRSRQEDDREACMYIYMYMFIYLYIRIHISIFLCTYTQTYSYIYTCTTTYTYTCICICLYL